MPILSKFVPARDPELETDGLAGYLRYQIGIQTEFQFLQENGWLAILFKTPQGHSKVTKVYVYPGEIHVYKMFLYRGTELVKNHKLGYPDGYRVVNRRRDVLQELKAISKNRIFRR